MPASDAQTRPNDPATGAAGGLAAWPKGAVGIAAGIIRDVAEHDAFTEATVRKRRLADALSRGAARRFAQLALTELARQSGLDKSLASRRSLALSLAVLSAATAAGMMRGRSRCD